jgi:hypothetical protein
MSQILLLPLTRNRGIYKGFHGKSMAKRIYMYINVKVVTYRKTVESGFVYM